MRAYYNGAPIGRSLRDAEGRPRMGRPILEDRCGWPVARAFYCSTCFSVARGSKYDFLSEHLLKQENFQSYQLL